MNECELWGFDGELGGNEERWMGRLPILRQGGRFFVARSLDWSPKSPRTLTRLPTEQAALDAGTALSIDDPVPAEPGRIVVLIGPKYRTALERLGGRATTYLDPFRPIQHGYLFAYQKAVEFEVNARRLSVEAKKSFDEEMVASGMLWVTPRAEAALDALRGNAYGHDEEFFVRALAAAQIEGNLDRFRARLAVTAASLGESEETLLVRLGTYLWTT